MATATAAAAAAGNFATKNENERKLNSMILQLQMVREHLLNQVSI